MLRQLSAGLVAGAAGASALNIVTYLDMTARGRPASAIPEEMAGRFASAAGIDLGEGDEAGNRRSGLGALLGYATGLGVGAMYGLLRAGGVRRSPGLAALALGGAAMAASDVPAASLGLTDLRTWGLRGWLGDLVPHLAYGAITFAVYERLADPGRHGTSRHT